MVAICIIISLVAGLAVGTLVTGHLFTKTIDRILYNQLQLLKEIDAMNKEKGVTIKGGPSVN